MEICNVSTPRLKALTKRNTYNVHRDGECYPQFNKKLTHNVDCTLFFILPIRRFSQQTCKCASYLHVLSKNHCTP